MIDSDLIADFIHYDDETVNVVFMIKLLMYQAYNHLTDSKVLDDIKYDVDFKLFLSDNFVDTANIDQSKYTLLKTKEIGHDVCKSIIDYVNSVTNNKIDSKKYSNIDSFIDIEITNEINKDYVDELKNKYNDAKFSILDVSILLVYLMKDVIGNK